MRFNTITKYFKKKFKKFRKWHKNVKKKFKTNSKYFFIFYDKIVYAQKSVKNIIKNFWKIRKKVAKKTKKIRQINDLIFFLNYIDSFDQRKIDVEIKWNNAKQIINQNVEKYVTYLNNLKINLNINESTSKLKLFKNLNNNFRNFVIFDNASTIRYEIFVKILINEHFFFREIQQKSISKKHEKQFLKTKKSKRIAIST